jgi:hypothetical protein
LKAVDGKHQIAGIAEFVVGCVDEDSWSELCVTEIRYEDGQALNVMIDEIKKIAFRLRTKSIVIESKDEAFRKLLLVREDFVEKSQHTMIFRLSTRRDLEYSYIRTDKLCSATNQSVPQIKDSYRYQKKADNIDYEKIYTKMSD